MEEQKEEVKIYKRGGGLRKYEETNQLERNKGNRGKIKKRNEKKKE